MQTKKRHPWINIISFLLFFFAFFIHYTDIVDISIKNARPIIIIPLLTAFSMFSGVGVSAAVGLVIGIFMDSVSSGTVCFNAAVLMVSAALVSVCTERLFNRNIRAAVLLCLLTCLFYFLLRWVCFYAFGIGVQENLTYLLRYAFPGMLYTTVFIFPFYFLYKYFYKIINA